MAFGYGFISGLLSAILGIVGLGLVLSAHFPEYLTQADLRPLYSSPFLRAAIHLTLVTSFLLGSISAVLRANKALALTGIGLTLGAALLGGSQAPLMVQNHGTRSWLGLDFFVLNLLLYSAVFIPLERLFALRGDQPVFRRHWLVDLTYFFVNSLLIEVLTILTLQPALILFDNVPGPRESQEPPETVASMDAEPENGDAGRRTPPHSRADLVGVSAGFRCETYRPLSAWLSESNVGRDEGRQARSRHPDTRRRSIQRTEPPREARQLSRVRSQSWRPQRPNRDRAADSVVRHSRRGVG